MNRIKNLIAISAFSLLVLALPAVASAQWGGNNGGYGNGNYNRNIRGTIQNLKNRSRNFERNVERADGRRDDRDDRWDNNRGGGWGNNRNDRWGNGNRNRDLGRLEQLAERFRNAADDLADEYGNGRNMNSSRDEARRVLDYGQQIEQEMRNAGANRNLQGEWNQIRNDLRVIASVYGGGYNNGGDWRNRIPFPF